jgi:alkylation response protein AidB-like acyl-CoA dehydrogenase
VAIGVSEEHEELRRAVRRWVDRHCTSEVVRSGLDAPEESLPDFWEDLAAQGWLGIHLPEEYGGSGFGLLELCVVAEELGRAVAPGPFLPTVLAGGVIAALGPVPLAKELLPRLADGTRRGAIALGVPVGAEPVAEPAADGSWRVTGTWPAVLGAPLGDVAVGPVRVDGTRRWCVADLSGDAGSPVQRIAHPCLDLTRRSGEVLLDGAVFHEDRVLGPDPGDRVAALTVVAAGAELTGSARWCLDTASEHARTRVQFGRPIGQFQGIKHKLADLLCAVEQMTASVWDAALAFDHADPDQARLAASTAASLTLDGGVRAAKDTIQVLGGMGFTWEHDAHLHLRRAGALRQQFGEPAAWRVAVADQARAGVRRSLAVELPAEADALRAELDPLVAEVAAAEPAEHRRLLGERGLLFPHWPAPYGRDAGPVEQLVIDQLLADHGLRRPPSNVMAWALPTLIAHGTPEQKERWVLPTLRGELLWCQLFSEPGAGSDLASLSTRATRGDGGWVLEGQKVWTSVAARAEIGICLARTDPSLPKHQGITYFVVDMKSAGLEVRPLREITGDALFNEVFLNRVFVPDDCVVGPVNGGWKLARTTLANERVSLASDSAFGGFLEALLAELGPPGGPGAPTPSAVIAELGGLLVDAQSLAVLGQRATLRSLSGLEPGPESSVRKLLGAEHDQRVADFGLVRAGPAGVYADGESAARSRAFLHTLCLTIAGGTSEVQRNVIGERLLGLPRDPEPEPSVPGGSPPVGEKRRRDGSGR